MAAVDISLENHGSRRTGKERDSAGYRVPEEFRSLAEVSKPSAVKRRGLRTCSSAPLPSSRSPVVLMPSASAFQRLPSISYRINFLLFVTALLDRAKMSFVAQSLTN